MNIEVIMNTMSIIFSTLFIILIVSWSIIILLIKNIRYIKKEIIDLDKRKRSQSTLYGQITEQFIPFMNSFPWDSKNFKFLGKPIDGIQFEKEKIIFVEFKTANSTLNSDQRNIRELVNSGKVEFELIKLK
ncbi:MAG: hypothetical protein CL758_03380 [Chloroflexi bacterium]|nr:hypothetical protein [Chloroflexota bacterium]|tara:strand:+ start:3864 stop:4256 length:393 start_codon:yes stop_codon:yes gene_type:complete